MIKRSTLALAFTALMAAHVGSVQATPITVEASLKSAPYGTEAFNFNVNGQSSSNGAGMLSFDIAKVIGAGPLQLGSSFLSFCVEFSQSISYNAKVNFTLLSAGNVFGTAKADAITRLFTGFGSQVNSSSTSAAFQLALWELIDDFDSSNWNSLQLTSGKFRVTSNNMTTGLAQSWLGQLSGITSKHQMYVLTNDLAQNQLIFAGTPLPQPAPNAAKVSTPATLGMFGFALVLLGLRRRQG